MEAGLPEIDRSTPDSGVYWLVFDGQCPFCRKWVRRLARLDWLRRIRFMDLHDPPAMLARRAPQLTPDATMESMHLVTPSGRILAGFDALRRAAWLLPVLWLSLPLWYLPGIPRLGRKVYQHLARSRYGPQSCSPGGSCRL